MASRLTVFFYIVLCLEAGAVLTIAPWVQWFGLSDWGDNFFLVVAAQKAGLHGLQRAVASGWVRGAVTGLGLLNLAMAFWEIFHFRETVRRLESSEAARPAAPEPTTPRADQAEDAARPADPDHLSHHARRDQ